MIMVDFFFAIVLSALGAALWLLVAFVGWVFYKTVKGEPIP